MINRIKLALVFCFTVLLLITSSCSKESAIVFRSLSLQETEQQYTSNTEVTKFIGLAKKVVRFAQDWYSISFDEKYIRFLPGSDEYLAWRLIALPKYSLTPTINSLYFDSASLESQKSKALQAGYSVYVDGENPLQVDKKPAPLLESWASWNYDRQVERVFQIIFYKVVQTTKHGDSEGLARFLAEKATEEYLLATLGGASPVLARYISEQRDEKTFASLYPDFVERVYNLYANRDPAATPESIETSRTQLLKAWVAEYQQRYTERFLTNRYGTFGNPLPSDAEILAWQFQLEPLRNWNQYQSEYRRAGESVAAYLNVLSK
jgi:hypothetical protein